MSEFVTELTSAESVHLAEVPNPTFLSLAPALIKKTPEAVNQGLCDY